MTKKANNPKRIMPNKSDLTIKEFRELTGKSENETSDEEAQEILDSLKTFCEVVYAIHTRKLEAERNLKK